MTHEGRGRRIVRRVLPQPVRRAVWDWRTRDERRFVNSVYEVLLRRPPDGSGRDHFVGRLRDGDITRDEIIEIVRGSEEFNVAMRPSDLENSLHLSRCDFVRTLPPARRILDLGGSSSTYPEGAFVHLGYPYPFELLTIVDLPDADRHALYRYGERAARIECWLGPVELVVGSMTDLGAFGDASIDLVYSGQTIEHVSPADADVVLHEVQRVLRPGGCFALDTPNGRVCRLHVPDGLTNPDHLIEYEHAELVEKIERAGLTVREAKGLNHAGPCLDSGVWDPHRVAFNRGVYADPTNCYLLAYVCQKI